MESLDYRSRATVRRGRFVRKHPRTGAVTLEAILAIPVLIIVLMAAFEFGTLAVIHQAVQAAVTESAREAAKVPTTRAAVDGNRLVLTVQNVVTQTLFNTHGIALADVTIDVDDMTSDGTITDPAEVRVNLKLELVDTPLPNLLGTFGVDLLSRNFDVTSISRRDCI